MFSAIKNNILREAKFSNDKKERYSLKREWDKSKNKILYIMLNPSLADEKKDTSSQLDIEPEESIYQGGFTSDNDKILFSKFHDTDWRGKFSMLEKFEDKRMLYFGERLIFNEAPEILPDKIQKRIKNQIADKIEIKIEN